MQLTKEAVEEFKRLYEEEFGEPLSFEEAEIRANEIIELYKMLAEPLPGECDDTTPRTDAKAPVNNPDNPPYQKGPSRTSSPAS